MDLLFVGGGFENINWFAVFVVQIPSIVSICMFNRRAIDPMKIAVQIPLFGAVGVSFANWLFAHALPLY